MRERERKLERKRLDFEMRSFRRAGMEKWPTEGLLRAVRRALRVPVAEVRGEDGSGPVSGVRAGGAGGEEYGDGAGDAADGGGDGVQVGVWDCSGGGEEAGGGGGGEDVEGGAGAGCD